ncbi:MAG: SDR family NAD(P)-dependent oxidoreductase [bacterium]|nr:SDR family NAD(P)-dependent oxidoreductase [bacterium]
MSSKIAVITGASGGIGEALARALAIKGYKLALAARRETELKRVAGELNDEAFSASKS